MPGKSSGGSAILRVYYSHIQGAQCETSTETPSPGPMSLAGRCLAELFGRCSQVGLCIRIIRKIMNSLAEVVRRGGDPSLPLQRQAIAALSYEVGWLNTNGLGMVR